MKTTFLDFEQSISELEAKIEELRFVQDDSALDISEEIRRLQKKSQTLTKDVYAKLNAWQVSQVARHPQPLTRWIMLPGCSPIFPSCTAIARLPTTLRLSAAWRVSMASR